ncbi:uncharacterized protein [Ambystoma mexicanum]|uniref:uncharacterized protein n=1 Tax=Ambystoma mexicanum TaxID=8296 RepID=UPI0037E9C4F2
MRYVLSQVTSELEEEMDPSSLDRAMSRSPPESLLESSVEERTGEQTPPLFVSPAPPPSSPIPEHPQTSQSGEGSQVLEGGSINGESSPTNQSEEQAEHRLQERSPLHDLPAQTQSGGRPGDEAGSSASPGVSQDPQGMPSVTEQQSEPSVPGKESPAPSDVPAVPPMDGSSEMSTELAELKKQHQQTTTRLKTDFQVLAAQWEEERRGLLQQINQAAKDQAISERKAAFALKELQRLNSEHRQTSPAGDVQQSGRSGLSSPFPGKRPSNGRPPRAVSPMSPRQRPGSRMVSETAFDDGIRRLHHGIRTMVESIKKGLLAQGLHSLAQLLDGGWVLEKNGILPALGEDRKAELAKSLEVLQNATEVFHSLLESISYHCGVPLMQEEMTSPRPENEDLESNQDDEERSQTGSLTSEKAIPTGKSSKRSIMAGFPQALRQERDLGNAADTVTHGPEDQSGIIFTHLDDTHNRRVLDRAVSSGRVPGDLYQGAILAMDSYGKVRRERLVTLLSGYLRISSLKGAVKRIKREVQCQPESGKGLRRLQELEKQVLHHWKEVRRQSSESRIRLSASLNETLRNVEEQSGIFLIKPVLSWPGGSSALKSSARINAYVKVVPKNLTSSTHPAAGQEISHLAISAKAAHGIRLSGISLPTNHSAKVGTNTVWSSNPPETGDHGTADVKQVLPSAMVITPKLLEMDVNNYLFDECRVSVISQSLDGSAASISRTPGAALLRNFLPVRRSTPVNQHSPEKR